MRRPPALAALAVLLTAGPQGGAEAVRARGGGAGGARLVSDSPALAEEAEEAEAGEALLQQWPYVYGPVTGNVYGPIYGDVTVTEGARIVHGPLMGPMSAAPPPRALEESSPLWRQQQQPLLPPPSLRPAPAPAPKPAPKPAPLALTVRPPSPAPSPAVLAAEAWPRASTRPPPRASRPPSPAPPASAAWSSYPSAPPVGPAPTTPAPTTPAPTSPLPPRGLRPEPTAQPAPETTRAAPSGVGTGAPVRTSAAAAPGTAAPQVASWWNWAVPWMGTTGPQARRLNEATTTSAPLQKPREALALVSNVDYNKLMADAALRAAFETAVKQEIARSAGQSLGADRVTVWLDPGSVRIFAAVQVATQEAASSVQAAITRGASALAESLATAVAHVDGIATASTGAISAQVQASALAAQVPPTAAPTTTATTTPERVITPGFCNPRCVEGRGVCTGGLCFCRTPYAGIQCEQVAQDSFRLGYGAAGFVGLLAAAVGGALGLLLFRATEARRSAARRMDEEQVGRVREVWSPADRGSK